MKRVLRKIEYVKLSSHDALSCPSQGMTNTKMCQNAVTISVHLLLLYRKVTFLS
jgi:hypothetical protein